MRRMIIMLVLLLAPMAGSGQTVVPIGEESIQFDRANQLYRQGEYQQAASIYEQIVSNGYESVALYFNLGNTYFKLNDIPSAILNYERAKRLSPTDDDVLYNLRLANARVVDRIDPVPELFFVEWWHRFINALSSDSWAIMAVLGMWCVAAASGGFMLGRSLLARRISFLSVVFAALIAACGFVGSMQRSKIEQNSSDAIVFAHVVTIKSAPDSQSTDLFIIHGGVKAELLDAVGEWRKIRLADGKVGWLNAESLRII
jgi:tetratricopeptide (TPR) repeat protein